MPSRTSNTLPIPYSGWRIQRQVIAAMTIGTVQGISTSIRNKPRPRNGRLISAGRAEPQQDPPTEPTVQTRLCQTAGQKSVLSGSCNRKLSSSDELEAGPHQINVLDAEDEGPYQRPDGQSEQEQDRGETCTDRRTHIGHAPSRDMDTPSCSRRLRGINSHGQALSLRRYPRTGIAGAVPGTGYSISAWNMASRE